MPNTILIVDDSPTAVPELKALLEGQGYSVVTALRAEEALDVLRARSIDLVITEALLPGIDGFELVRQIRKIPNLDTVPVIMLTVRSAPEDYALSYEVGADEYFLKPMDPFKIVVASRGLITRAEVAKQNPQASRAESYTPARAAAGRIITVFSLKGGVGTSTIAVNLAVAIKQLAPSARVGLVDLGLEEGADALLLDVRPTSSIAEWAREAVDEATPNDLNQYFVQHRSGVSLMAAPATPEQAETVRPAAIRRALELAPKIFDYIVVDTSSTFGENSLIALEAAESIILPMTPDMAAFKTTSDTLRILKAVNISGNRMKIVVNEIVPRAGLTRSQIEENLDKKVFSIPHAGPDFIDAANQGLPVVTALPTAAASRALIELASTLCDVEVAEAVPAARAQMPALPSGLLGRLDRLRRGV